MDAETVMGKSVSLAICGVMSMGMLCACFVALSLFLNEGFHTSNVERRKSAKIVVLSALFFAGVMALVAGALCSPNVDIRHAPATLHDLELKEIDLQLLAESVHIGDCFNAFPTISFLIMTGPFIFYDPSISFSHGLWYSKLHNSGRS